MLNSLLIALFPGVHPIAFAALSATWCDIAGLTNLKEKWGRHRQDLWNQLREGGTVEDTVMCNPWLVLSKLSFLLLQDLSLMLEITYLAWYSWCLRISSFSVIKFSCLCRLVFLWYLRRKKEVFTFVFSCAPTYLNARTSTSHHRHKQFHNYSTILKY